jgi:hypothetical protein
MNTRGRCGAEALAIEYLAGIARKAIETGPG